MVGAGLERDGDGVLVDVDGAFRVDASLSAVSATGEASPCSPPALRCRLFQACAPRLSFLAIHTDLRAR